MIRASIVIPFLFCVAISSSSSAATPMSGPSASPLNATPLSLNEAVARAEAHSQEVVFARHEIQAADARRVGAGIIMPTNPRLSVEARPDLSTGPFSELGYASTLDFAFDLGGAPGARVREAEAQGALARADLTLAKREARVRAWTSYLHARAGDERMAEITASIEIADRVLQASRKRAEVGAAGESEEMLAESERAQLEASLENARERRNSALMELRDELDLRASEDLVLTTALEQPPDAQPPSVLIARALRGRPELDVLRSRLALLDATYERLGKERFPKMGVYASVDAAPASPVFGILGFSIELPFVQRNQGPRAVTSALRDGEAEKLDFETRRIIRDVLEARATYESRRAQLNIVATTALPTAERTLDLIETGWRSGRFDVFRVTSAARDVARVRALRLDALEAVWMARVALDRAVGGLGT